MWKYHLHLVDEETGAFARLYSRSKVTEPVGADDRTTSPTPGHCAMLVCPTHAGEPASYKSVTVGTF